MHSDLHPCAHPGCANWALRRRSTCAAHAPEDESAALLAVWPGSAPPLDQAAPSGPFDLVLAQRDSLHRYLRLRPGHHPPSLAAELRHLRSLSLTAADLAPSQAGHTAQDEIDAFLDIVSRQIIEDPSLEAGP